MILYENLQKLNQEFIPEFESKLADFWKKGWYILGGNVSEFENDFAKYNHSRYCIGVANGLDALFLGLKVFDFSEKSEVIVPSNTYIATILSIINAGLTPILVEPNIDDYLINVSLIEEKITEKTVAIMPVHLYGKLCDVSKIIELASKYNLKIIEDCAQAHGATIENKKAGSFGDIGAFSFYPTKNLGAFGDGGAITTNSEELYLKLKALRNYGSEKKYYNKYIGINSRLDEIQAIFLKIKLDKLDKINLHKSKLASIYNEKINNPHIIKPVNSNSEENVYHIYPIRTKYRSELKEYLLSHNIQSEIHYPLAPHQQEGYKNILLGNYPLSEEIHATVLSLPISYANTTTEIEYVCDVINNFKK
jgi:dTDP-4-amino-4,6-dideoxygalactose transaminase